MRRYIDATTLKEQMITYGFHSADQTVSEFVEDTLLTVDVRENKRGKWGSHGECPFCGYLRQWEEDNYCGNCGAEMKGREMDDLIKKQDAIDACLNGCCACVNDCVDEIKKLPSAQQWIPCSESLPKYNKTVLISIKQKGKEEMVFTAQRRRRVNKPDVFRCCMNDEGWWDFRISAWDDHEVVAWMPLPKPMKGGEK